MADWLTVRIRQLSKVTVVTFLEGSYQVSPTWSTTAQKQPPDVADARMTYPCEEYAGSVDGYYFGTKNDTLGYHKLDAALAAIPISLNDLLQPDASS